MHRIEALYASTRKRWHTPLGSSRRDGTSSTAAGSGPSVLHCWAASLSRVLCLTVLREANELAATSPKTIATSRTALPVFNPDR